jgi:diguanylate cyclase (GGDEF)-like protein
MDIHTLQMEHIVLLAIFSLLSIANVRMHRGVKGIIWFVVYGLSLLVGATLVGLRGAIADGVSIFVGDLMFSVSYIFLHRSMTEFFDRGALHQRVQIGMTVALVLALVVFGLYLPMTRWRLFAFSAALSAQLATTAIFVARATPPYMRAAGRAMAAVIALLCLSNFVRMVSLLFVGAPGNYLQGGTMLAWTLLDNTVLQGGVIIAYVWMTAARLHHGLEKLAVTDPLTGLMNRRGLEMAARHVFAAGARNRTPVSAILFDLDEFKGINDSFGHPCGDATLVAVAGCLTDQIRQQDLAARLGGDEFVVLLPQTQLAVAMAVAERLRAVIADLRIRHHTNEFSVHGSFGVAQIDDSSLAWDALMADCDKALYRAKHQGGNLVSV